MTTMKMLFTAASLILLASASTASAQTTVFSHDFENATPGELSAAGTLGTPSVGTLEAPGGFVSATRPAYTSGNNVMFNSINTDGAAGFGGTPGTIIGFDDVGTPAGNFLTVNLSEPAAVTGVLGAGQTTTVDFNLASFGNNNTAIFKYVHVVGQSSAGAEVFHILWRAGSNTAAREVFARELGQDNTEFVSVDPPVVRDGNTIDYDFSSVEGTLLATNFNFALNNTNTGTAPAGQVAVSVTIDENGWNASAGPAENGGGATQTPASGLGIASGATDLASIVVFSSHNDLNTSNVGFWVDNIVVETDLTVEGTPSLLGDFNGDLVVDCADIDEYIGNLDSDAAARPELDLVADGTIDSADFEFLVEELVETTNGQVGTFLGDLNCDGTVNVLGDAFILVGSLGQPTASYSEGDIDLNGTVDVLGDAFVLVGNLGSTNEK